VQYSKVLQLKRPSRFLVTASITAVIALLLANAAMPAIERQLDRWGMLPRHEALTELYFTDASALQKTYSTSTPQTLSFTVTNREGRTMQYRAMVRASSEDKSQKQELATRSFSLESGKTAQVQLPVTIMDLGRRVYISVTLSNNEQIGYWVRKQG